MGEAAKHQGAWAQHHFGAAKEGEVKVKGDGEQSMQREPQQEDSNGDKHTSADRTAQLAQGLRDRGDRGFLQSQMRTKKAKRMSTEYEHQKTTRLDSKRNEQKERKALRTTLESESGPCHWKTKARKAKTRRQLLEAPRIYRR